MDYFVYKSRNIPMSGLGISFISEAPRGDSVVFTLSHGYSARSYGENISVTLTPQPNGTRVEVFSECAMPTQLFDLGKNEENVKGILNFLENGMPSGAPQPQFQQPPQIQPQMQPQPQPQPQRASTPKFCGNCGAAAAPGARFCTQCGKSLF